VLRRERNGSRALLECWASLRHAHGDGEVVRWAVTKEPWRRDRGPTVSGLPEIEIGRQGLGHEVGFLLKLGREHEGEGVGWVILAHGNAVGSARRASNGGRAHDSQGARSGWSGAGP
jgi:hypothetical protein